MRGTIGRWPLAKWGIVPVPFIARLGSGHSGHPLLALNVESIDRRFTHPDSKVYLESEYIPTHSRRIDDNHPYLTAVQSK
ncbi:hypothetical protein CC2G_007040 [Coprinopsis cinerea AmutBmut pab1-1]|nr:hypothetical protein CC2G_007040 [Coprinopsis cinerea AmutBmut pab1-1]